MASTNKTANFELSQYIGTDKPTYLGDYNSDMLKIDTAMATNKTNADNAVAVATASNQTAGNAQSTATQAQQTANEANSLAQTAKTSADNAQSSADEANEKIDNFNLTQFSTIASNQMSTDHGTVNSASKISIATNGDGTLCKIYGYVSVTNPNFNGSVNVTFNTSLRPNKNMTINPAGIRVQYDSTGINSVSVSYITIETTGKVTVTLYSSTTLTNVDVILMPCLYWLKSFGDVQSEI